jgi:hypothetical protein
MKNKRSILRGGFYFALVFSFLVALTSLWLNRTFYSPNTLADITTEVLQEESSRNAISNLIVDRVFEDRPALAATVGPRLVPVISGLLGSDFVASSLNNTVERLRVAFTSDTPEEIVINLVPIKSTIVAVQNTIGQTEEEKRVNTEDIPDEIVLLDTSNFPNYSDEGIVVLWLGPLSLAFILTSAGIWIYRGRKNKGAFYLRIRIVAALGALAGIIALFVGPLIEPVFVRYARTAESQTVVRNLYEGLIESFNQQATALLVLSIIVFFAAVVAPKIISKYKKIVSK